MENSTQYGEQTYIRTFEEYTTNKNLEELAERAEIG